MHWLEIRAQGHVTSASMSFSKEKNHNLATRIV